MVATVELEVALALLREQHKDHAQRLLKEHGLPSSGTWDDLLDRLRRAVTKDTVPFDEVVSTLDSAEEHGHHHVFLYDLPATRGLPIRDVATIKRLVGKEGLENVFNTRTRIIDKPPKPVCTSIRHDGTRIRVKWVERRVWEEFLKGKDRVEGSVRWRGFEQHDARAVNTVRIDLDSGTVEVRISDAGKENRKDYKERLEEYGRTMAWLMKWDVLQKVPIARAIPRIKGVDKQEVQVRANVYQTARGMTASFTSDAADSDVREDPVYRAGDTEANKEGQDHRLLNVNWLPRPGTPLTRKVHTYLYGDGVGNEVRFSADCTEEEVTHVLHRIREFARA